MIGNTSLSACPRACEGKNNAWLSNFERAGWDTADNAFSRVLSAKNRGRSFLNKNPRTLSWVSEISIQLNNCPSTIYSECYEDRRKCRSINMKKLRGVLRCKLNVSGNVAVEWRMCLREGKSVCRPLVNLPLPPSFANLCFRMTPEVWLGQFIQDVSKYWEQLSKVEKGSSLKLENILLPDLLIEK